MYLEYTEDGHFEAATGTLKLKGEGTKGIVENQSCMWIEDTKDGGASQFISTIDDKLLKRYRQEPDPDSEVPLDWRSEAPSGNASSGMHDRSTAVHATCHCGDVQFYITYPNEFSKNASSYYPDLMIPYHIDSNASVNPENQPWWLAGSARDHYLAGTCACVTCRRSSGFDITFWAFIPTMNIFLDAACSIPFTRTRSFCGKCGANIFWDGDERPSLIDVAAGLLDAKSGIRAEELLAWWPERVSFEEDAMNRELIMGLGKGLREWSDRNKGADYVAMEELPTGN